MDKKLRVKYSFNKNASTYEKYAHVQKEVARILFSFSKDVGVEISGMVLDIGSGAGEIGQVIYSSIDDAYKVDLIQLDLSYNMCLLSAKNVGNAFLNMNGDMDYIPIKNNSIDCVISSMVFHWASDLDNVINEAVRVVKPGGYVVFSMVLDGTLKELITVLHQDSVKRFFTFQEIESILSRNESIYVVSSSEKILTSMYTDVYDILIEIKKTGVGIVDNAVDLIKAGLKNIDASYKRNFSIDGKIPVSWNIGYFIFKRND